MVLPQITWFFLMFSDHSEHFHIDDHKADKLPNYVASEPFCAFCGYWRIITLFVRFPECHIFKYIGSTAILMEMLQCDDDITLRYFLLLKSKIINPCSVFNFKYFFYCYSGTIFQNGFPLAL